MTTTDPSADLNPPIPDIRDLVAKFEAAFAVIESGQSFPLDELYAEDVDFEDPLHKHRGRAAVERYFTDMYRVLERGSIAVEARAFGEREAFLRWTMTIHLRRPRGVVIRLPGVTHLVAGPGGVIRHRDFFDTGVGTFRQLPGLRTVARLLTRVMS